MTTEQEYYEVETGATLEQQYLIQGICNEIRIDPADLLWLTFREPRMKYERMCIGDAKHVIARGLKIAEFFKGGFGQRENNGLFCAAQQQMGDCDSTGCSRYATCDDPQKGEIY